MSPAELSYVSELVRAWAQGRSGPVPPPAAVDPAAVWRLLGAHNVEAALGPLLPAELRPATFDAELAEARRRTDTLLLECERVLPAVAAAADRAVLLKGAALALQHYPEPEQRWFLDLDLLVARDRIDAATQALHRLGYRLLNTGYDPSYYDRHHFHRVLLGPQGACLELHWELTLPASAYRHPSAGLFARAVPLQVGRRLGWAAAPVDQVLHAVYQNIADGYRDLRRILDLALLLPCLDQEDWRILVRLASQGGLTRALWLTLHLVKLIAQVDAPAAVMTALAPGQAARRTVRGLDLAAACLSRRAQDDLGFTPLLHLLTAPRADSRWQELRRLIWPGEGQLLERGHPTGRLPRFGARLWLAVRQTALLGRMGGMVLRALSQG